MQAYGKRAIPLIRWLRRVAEQNGKRIPVRLVKGAYWDSEIKWAQERGLEDYPVFSRKLHTDVSYLAAMRLLLSDSAAFYPQFATHNAHTVASAFVAGGAVEFEYQRLHGMGEALYEQIAGEAKFNRPCRIYAPVGGHEDLLGYLVRRLLENGANTSFVNRLGNDEMSVSEIIADPVEIADREFVSGERVPLIVRPRDIFLPERKNSAGAAARRGKRAPGAAGRHRQGFENALRFRADHQRQRNDRRRCRIARRLSARSSRAHRHGAARNAAKSRRRARRSHDRGGALGANGRLRAGARFSSSRQNFSNAIARR